MNLISKKDLLAITGISYGQLYRWKRERLIPEEWFIKQSAYTGQETFFPRDQILSRIKSILDMKDHYSLEELAKMLSPETGEKRIPIESMQDISEINSSLLERLPQILDKTQYDILEVTMTIAISRLAARHSLSIEEMEDLLRKSMSAGSRLRKTNVIGIIFTIDKEFHVLFSSDTTILDFDSTITVIDQIALEKIADEIKLKYKNRFIQSS